MVQITIKKYWIRLLPKEREWKQKSAKFTKSHAKTCMYFEHAMSKFAQLLKACLNRCNLAMLYQHHPVLSGPLKHCWSNNIGQYCIFLNRALLHSLLAIYFMTVSFFNRNIESVDASSMVQPDVGRKIVFDNFDFIT